MPTAPVINIDQQAPRTTIRTATGQAIASMAAAELNIPTLSSAACKGHIMPTFTNNLLSLGKLCDSDCYVLINKHALHVYDINNRLVLRGDRERTGARLWRINLLQTHPPQPHPLLNTPQAIVALAQQTPQTTATQGPHVIENDDTPPATQPVPAPPMHAPPEPPAQSPPLPALQPAAHVHDIGTHKRAYDLPSTRALIEYLHATAGHPVKSTWLSAIKSGYFHSWPGLTYATAARYCPDSDATIKGHMAQARQHTRSTQPRQIRQQNLAPDHDQQDLALDRDVPPAHTLEIMDLLLNKLFTDDTGRFPIRARSGNQYLMVAYHYLTNAILIQPFASKADAHRIRAYQTIMTKLKTRNQTVHIHILDNEASAAYRTAITANGCTYQLVPPHVHRRNAAERAIRIFKDHFLAILAGVDPSFPATRWDLLLPQAELTLNLLRSCRYDKTISAWEGLNGYFKFDATPLGPLGSRVITHAKPQLRKSWDYRGQDGFYVGPALTHYRCYAVLKKDSQAVIISDTVRFRHHRLAFPNLMAEDKIIHALQALTGTLAGTARTATDGQLQAIATLRDIFQNYATPNTPEPAPAPPGLPPTPAPAAPRVVPASPPRVLPDTVQTDLPWTVVPPRTQPRPTQPIATRTRARQAAGLNSFAALAAMDDDTCNSTHPTAPLAMPVLDAATGRSLEHRQLRRHPTYKQVWDTSYANELGRLCQGIGTSTAKPNEQRVPGSNTFHPIRYTDIPYDRRQDVTYTRVVCEVRPHKSEPNRTRITIGGNRICYPGDTGTKTGSIELVKTLLNSVVSRKDARFACFDISNFYLGTPLDRPEFVRIKLADIPDEFIQEYDLTTYAHDGWIYFKITKGVYGLKQAGKLANDLLTERLAAHGYYQCATTPGLWRHKWRPIMFVLIVDDFGIEYCDRRHAEHLLTALQETYKVTTDWTGTKFAGIDIAWDYKLRTCRLTMNAYIADVLLKYGHTKLAKPQHAPHKHREIVYGAKMQLIPDTDTSESSQLNDPCHALRRQFSHRARLPPQSWSIYLPLGR